MSIVKISLRDNGPLIVEGPIEVVDAEGNAFPLSPDKPAVALCRCGHSASKPFCDGAHRSSGFQSSDRAPTG